MSVEALRKLFDDHISVTTSSGTTPPDQVSALSPLLPEETPLGYDSWAEKRRREFRAGRHHAKHALLAAGAPSACILRDADGVPQFPSGFSGSITHTGRSKTYAAAIV